MALDYSTPVGRVRLLIPDTDPATQLLIDPQIQAYLDMEGGSIKLAAAQALDSIASSEAMVSKVISMNGLSINGPAVAAELRARATGLREQVAEGLGDDGVGFDVVDFDPYVGYLGYPPE
ncbi:hypothetical protein AB0395_41250 [Streptosporangium sp. NPDC051023]|uniref:hypothetical protein n=1 Tax=Streptosporangium sp. NPDC051023 TaxID=3155410 RepID=UPI00344FCFD6